MSANVTRLDCSSDRIAENSQLRMALIDSVTHDIRTPLTSIKAAVTALLTGARVRPSQRNELLSIINEEADRLNRLVGDIVEVSQLGYEVNLDLGSHTMASIIFAAEADCRPLLGNRLLSVRLEPGLPTVRADLQRAKNALAQLLGNAIKYSPPEQPIVITANLREGFVKASVIDRGSGISLSEQKLIFERFYRGKEHRNVVHGTGVGLHVANAIIEAHGGSLSVSSRCGRGSTFSFTLPVDQDTSDYARSGGFTAIGQIMRSHANGAA